MKKIFVTLAVITFFILGCLIGFYFMFPSSIAEILIHLNRSNSGLSKKQIKLPNGLETIYLEGGTGETIVLLHGAGQNKDNFTEMSRFLTDKYHVIIPDRIGYGESSKPMDIDYSPIAQSEYILQLLNALDIQQFHLVGSSQGGQIAMIYTHLNSERVKSLFLLNAYGVQSVPRTELMQKIHDSKDNFAPIHSIDEFKEFLGFFYHKTPYIPGPVLDFIFMQSSENFERDKLIFYQVVYHDIEKVITREDTPALIIWGDDDKVIHIDGAKVIQKLFPNSQLVIMKDTGHLPMLEKPDETANHYFKFLESLQ
ncbi:MAG: alpha/beta hydrolase [Spirochaetia bacterium]|nr:alpha/beta hydrolase [Spirochaetia bacterium]